MGLYVSVVGGYVSACWLGCFMIGIWLNSAVFITFWPFDKDPNIIISSKDI